MISLYVDKILVATFSKLELVWAHEAFEQGIRRHLKEGIWYPPGSLLEDYTISAKAPIEQKINKVCVLYSRLFRARVEYCCNWTEADALGRKAMGPGCDACLAEQGE